MKNKADIKIKNVMHRLLTGYCFLIILITYYLCLDEKNDREE